MSHLNLLYVYAYSTIVAHMFYFHNLFLKWDGDLFARLINEYPLGRMIFLTTVIGLMIVLLVRVVKFK